MVADYVLPEVEFTVDELSILPDECRYELIDGRLDLWDRSPLSDLAGLAVMSSLKVSCPHDFQVLPRPTLWPESEEMPPPDLVVLGPGGDGDIRLVIDVVQLRWLFADMLERSRAYVERDVPAYWVFESARLVGAALTVFRRAPGGGFDAGMSTREVFTVNDPFPVAIDLPRLSDRWWQTFEYAGPRDTVLRS
ncbi:Uma2 family endonuclease [Actinoplanes sp. TRM 88003]|uniref:Uma2 family endonuclease n=1 Tax=Paractinoplanes aksuensis TaxID=2939490 RepID=A0ABT1DPD0_9ACTN|nr:Uma2 family endonuclease [Actinoplanes aksuensis]MCO8271926.1 Uma2 family endonuclease [Actinoplanes aksuensis]